MFRGRGVTRGWKHLFSVISGFACKVKEGRNRLTSLWRCGSLRRSCPGFGLDVSGALCALYL
jgi:hypothetical protein